MNKAEVGDLFIRYADGIGMVYAIAVEDSYTEEGSDRHSFRYITTDGDGSGFSSSGWVDEWRKIGHFNLIFKDRDTEEKLKRTEEKLRSVIRNSREIMNAIGENYMIMCDMLKEDRTNEGNV